MRLKWNASQGCFEAEFQNFQSDLEAVKSAGFKTSGPPDWTWYTPKTGPLEKLRKNRPASGLTILEDALVEYNRIKQQDETKTALLAELKAAKKVVKQKEEPVIPGKWYHDIKVEPTIHIAYVAPPWTGPVCFVCKDHVYFYEKQDPPTCLTCENLLDNAPELF